MRKIALSGIKGRKKDSFLMGVVVLLSIVFIIATTVLHTSSSTTQAIERLNTFGEWKTAAFHLESGSVNDLKDIFDDMPLAKSTMLGENNRLGIIGTYNEPLVNLGRLSLIEGDMPMSDNEIAIEYNLFMYFKEPLEIGDRISLNTAIVLYEMDYWDAYEAQINRLAQEIAPRIESKDYESNSPIANFIRNYESNPDLNQVIEAKSLAVALEFHTYLERNMLEHEMHDDIKVELKQTYFFVDIRDSHWLNVPTETADPNSYSIEEILEKGTLSFRSIQLSKDMVLSGILETYTTFWDTDDYMVSNSFISEHSGNLFFDAFYNNTLFKVTGEYFPTNVFLLPDESPMAFYKEYSNSFPTLKRNTFSYPDNYGTDNVLMYGILGLIFLATIASVFQINLTQMRRRARKLALLKSIGTTNPQLALLLIWEFVYVIALTIPLGIFLGLFAAWGLISVVNAFNAVDLLFTLDLELLIVSICLGIVSILLGVSVPLIKAIRTPFNSTLSPPPKRRKKTLKHSGSASRPRSLKIQTFTRISLKHAKFERKKHLITLGLYTTAITVLIGTILLSYFAFDPYVDSVIITNKPAYAYEYLKGLSSREIIEFKEEIHKIEGVEHVSVVKYGLQSHLWHPRLIDHPTYEFQGSKRDSSLYPSINDSNKHLMDDAVMTNVYGYTIDDPTFLSLLNQLSEYQINLDAFERGDEVILLLPYYHKDQLFKKSYDFRKIGALENNYEISVGDEVSFTTPTEDIGGGIDLTFHTAKVSAIVNSFDHVGMWPYSDTLESPVVIGSYNLITTLYPASITRMRLPEAYLKKLVDTLFPTRFGRTSVHIYPSKNADLLSLKMDLQRFAQANDTKLMDLKLESDVVYGRGLKVAAIIAMLGISITTICLLILYNTSLSKLEQERERVGILQALGVTHNQFKRGYFVAALGFAVGALLIAHLINGLVLLLTVVSYGGQILTAAADRLWLYPWHLHWIACASFLFLAILSYYLPIYKIINNQPVYNISSLQD